MAEAKSVQVVRAIQSSLENIRTSKAYLTEAGKNIHRGFLAYALQADEKLATPCIVIQVDSEALTTQGTLNGRVTLNLTIFVVDKADKNDRLQAAISDVRRALIRYEELPGKVKQTMGVNQYGSAAYNPQPDSNFALAAITVGVNFMENY